MSKHKDKTKERSRDDRYSRERDRDQRKRSRDRSRDRNRRKKSKERSRRSRSKKSSRNRSRSRDYSRRSRSRDYRRSRSYERSERSRRRSNSPQQNSSLATASKISVTPSQQAQITQFLSASLSGLSQSQAVVINSAPAFQPENVVRTDFSNLFQSSSSTNVLQTGPNSKALAIAAEKAKNLLRAKNLTDTLKVVSNGNSVTSNGNESSRDGEEFRGGLGSCENSATGDASNSEDKRKKKKSRWASSNDGNEGKIFIPGMPTILPSNLNPDQQEAYLVQLQIEEISRKLRTGDLGISMNPEERSPSPEPIYSTDGKRLNTREFRTRKKLEEQRHLLITRMQCMNPEFKPPADYKPPVTRVSDKVLIPQEEHPDINFVGLLIGPRGNTLKAMEKDTGAKIIIRGKGSVKEGKVSGKPLPGEDEPLHAFITANNLESVKKAVDKIKEVIKQGIEVPEGSNDLRRMQLRELAQLNGTLRENDGLRCTNCGSTDHKSFLCPDKPNVTNNIVCSACGSAGHISKDCKSKRPGLGGVEGSNNQAKIDEEYMSLMAELGEAIPSQETSAPPARENPPALIPPKPTFNIFDNQRHHQPRPPVPPAPIITNPMNNANNTNLTAPPCPPIIPPPWHQHPPPPVHAMGQYPPPPMPSWIPPLPGQKMNVPPPMNYIPPPPGTDNILPPGTHPISFNSFEDDRFGKKSQPPLPFDKFWSSSDSFLPPPPPPE